MKNHYTNNSHKKTIIQIIRMKNHYTNNFYKTPSHTNNSYKKPLYKHHGNKYFYNH